jgi:hypothetical protein
MKLKKVNHSTIASTLGAVIALIGMAVCPLDARASDHADAPAVAHDGGADIGDAYLFLDPANTNNVIMIMTLHGFMVPGQNVARGFFDPNVRYRFELETSGDAKADEAIDITFAPPAGPTNAQIATVRWPNRSSFEAPATPPSLAEAAPAPVLTTNGQGVVFFAGLVDDPFFADLPAFRRYLASVLNGAPDSTVFLRARDTFAGYNNHAIALSVPAELIRLRPLGTNANTVLGMVARTQRRTETVAKNGDVRARGGYRNVDRAGVPLVNLAFVPFENAASGVEDAREEFAGDILAALNALGVSTENQQALAEVAIERGDYLRLDLTVPNLGTGRGVSDEPYAFPNGRRPQDDVMDVLLEVISNGTIISDNVDANDVSFRGEFPFLAPPQQPRPFGVIDDNTRN